jgi:predicted ATP-grasp superfamily ATP-dependent carboligase
MAAPDDVPGAYEKASVCGPLMMQEVVPGDDTDFYTFGAYQDASSRALGVFVSRKVRQHPRNFGESRIAESCWVDEVADDALRLLHELSFHGVSGTEFKRDPRDGRLKLMEVNARHWLHHCLATAAGVNLSLIAYGDALGRPIEGGKQIDGVRWLDFPRETRDSLLELARGELSVATFVSGLRTVRVDAVFSLDDPLPALRELVNATTLQVQRDLPKLLPGSR